MVSLAPSAPHCTSNSEQHSNIIAAMQSWVPQLGEQETFCLIDSCHMHVRVSNCSFRMSQTY